ncbi:MAG: 3-hydroxyacyl-ACP dehydratase FabZ [Alphaproteobacteria bacterium]|nr:3-hydroxyacyl-ACP dehydratase FabZ [Alphaproteobacteria bacterium]MBR6664043.1 3-hydroxyacyl-ACP dehydratase FabZ [Alphaproteobacteria bacterium]MBR6729746.1 3-hydroxyacyl-ACP dehydratase FabZ [Alphaproteobacteria bacterium]
MEEIKQEEQTNIIEEMRIGEILKLLPHRYPFLLVDRLKNVVPGESGIGIKNVTMNEEFFQGHFPENPVMPGVLQIEAMAQTAGIIVLTAFPEEERSGNSVYFMTVDEVKFRKPILPGDVIEFYVKKEQAVRNVFKFRGEAKVDGKLVSQATFSAMVFKKA